MSFIPFEVTRNSTKSVIGKDGTLVTVPNNTHAFVYDTDKNFKGLLVESPGQNLIRYSSDLAESSFWNYYNITVVDDTTTTTPPAEISSENVYKLTSTNSVSYIYEEYFFSNNVLSKDKTYNLSFYIKSGSTDQVSIYSQQYDSNGNLISGLTDSCIINIENNTLDGNAVDLTITRYDAGNGWTRIQCSFQTQNSTNSDSIKLKIALVKNGSIAGTTGEHFYISSPQIVGGGPVTYYYPTNGAPFTGARETIVKRDSVDNYINYESGSIFVEVDIINISPNTGGNSKYFIQANSETDSINNRIYLGINNNEKFQFGIKTTNVDYAFSTNATTGIHKLAITYKTSELEQYIKVYLDGSLVHSIDQYSPLLSNSLNEIYLGSSDFIYSESNNYIRGFAIYNRPLTEQEATNLTSTNIVYTNEKISFIGPSSIMKITLDNNIGNFSYLHNYDDLKTYNYALNRLDSTELLYSISNIGSIDRVSATNNDFVWKDENDNTFFDTAFNYNPTLINALTLRDSGSYASGYSEESNSLYGNGTNELTKFNYLLNVIGDKPSDITNYQKSTNIFNTDAEVIICNINGINKYGNTEFSVFQTGKPKSKSDVEVYRASKLHLKIFLDMCLRYNKKVVLIKGTVVGEGFSDNTTREIIRTSYQQVVYATNDLLQDSSYNNSSFIQIANILEGEEKYDNSSVSLPGLAYTNANDLDKYLYTKSEYTESDNLHYNANGYGVVSDIVRNALKRLEQNNSGKSYVNNTAPWYYETLT